MNGIQQERHLVSRGARETKRGDCERVIAVQTAVNSYCQPGKVEFIPIIRDQEDIARDWTRKLCYPLGAVDHLKFRVKFQPSADLGEGA